MITGGLFFEAFCHDESLLSHLEVVETNVILIFRHGYSTRASDHVIPQR